MRKNPYLSPARSITTLVALWCGVLLAVVAETFLDLFREDR